MQLAITGGAGFLGYHLALQLQNKFEKILLLDIASINSGEYPVNCEYRNIDIRDIASLNQSLRGVDCVIHGAAALPLWKSRDIFNINVGGTENVIKASIQNGIKRMVYVSSTAVYGVPEKHPLFEYDSMVGIGPYGESKIEAEKICEKYRNQICISIVRPKTFIGTGRLGVFQILYDWIENGKRIPIIGNGKNRYQLLEVEDLVDAIHTLLVAPVNVANDTFNIGAEIFKTVNEDLGALCNYAKSNARVMKTPAKLVKPILALLEALRLSPLYRWVYGTADKDSFVSIEKVKTKLNWKPKYSNSMALIRSYQWYLDHKNECQGVGITHRVAWKQGFLGFLKRFM